MEWLIVVGVVLLLLVAAGICRAAAGVLGIIWAVVSFPFKVVLRVVGTIFGVSR